MISLQHKKNEYDENIFIAYGDDNDFKCSMCLNKIQEGYICEDNPELILCEYCQNNYKMARCKYKANEHRHIKFIRGSNV
jgi:NAD-dependent SIR2 family protein deacetylase